MIHSPVHVICTLMSGEFDGALNGAEKSAVVSVMPSLQLSAASSKSLCHGRSLSMGSTETGDSFVLAIDWNEDALNLTSQGDESFEDPYLEPIEALRLRRRKQHSFRAIKEEEDELEEPPKSSRQVLLLREDPPPSPISTVPSLTVSERAVNSTPNSKSLGSFTFTPSPATSKSLGAFCLSELQIPRQLKFADSSKLIRTVSSSDETEATSESSVCPSVALHEADMNVAYWIERLEHSPPKKRALPHYEVGAACLKAKRLEEAIFHLKQAASLWQDQPVARARALDRLGMTLARRDKLAALHYTMEAFRIRLNEFGPWHVDTVDSMNHLARQHLVLHDYAEACRCYWEVFWVRKAIFGRDHPSVAVSAHDLAIAFAKNCQFGDANTFFQIAMEVYDKMGLPVTNPAVRRLMSDMRKMEERQRWVLE